MIPFERFLQLPTAEVAALVRATGPKVCVFPFNGTRRWFLLEHSVENQRELANTYVEETIKNRCSDMFRVSFIVIDHKTIPVCDAPR